MSSVKPTYYVDPSEHGEFEEAGHGVIKGFKNHTTKGEFSESFKDRC